MMNPPETARASILRRIVIMSWLIAVVSVLVFAAAMIFSQRRSMGADMKQQSKTLATMIAARVGPHITGEKRSRVVEICQDVLAGATNLRYITIKNRSTTLTHISSIHGLDRTATRWDDSRILNGPEWEPEAAAISEPRKTGILEEDPVVWHHAESSSHLSTSWGWVGLGLSMVEYDKGMKQIYMNTALAAAVILLFSVAAAYKVARNIILPLRDLKSFAQKVSGGALNARASVAAGGEIGDLAESINRMVESLEQSNSKVRESVKSTASLREKEILLREIHHRVKNNMQILTSLLRLQTRQADSQELRDVLQESEARIRSMGLLHEKLYQSDSVSTIDMQGYLRTLTGELMRMNTPQGARREVKLSVHNVHLGLDTALPCGLIITELVTNSLKYAFPGRSDGIVFVSLGTNAEGDYNLVVWDNGVGMDSEFDIAKAASLGMRLVKMLTDQLNGRLTFDGAQGTRVEISFKESQYKVRL